MSSLAKTLGIAYLDTEVFTEDAMRKAYFEIHNALKDAHSYEERKAQIRTERKAQIRTERKCEQFRHDWAEMLDEYSDNF